MGEKFLLEGQQGFVPRCQGISGSGVWLIGRGRGASRRVENEGAFVVEANFRGDPVGGEDVFWVNRLWIGVVGGDPLADGGPGRIDRLKGVDVEWGIGRWGEVDETLPESVESEEEFDGFGTADGFDAAERAAAAWVICQSGEARGRRGW